MWGSFFLYSFERDREDPSLFGKSSCGILEQDLVSLLYIYGLVGGFLSQAVDRFSFDRSLQELRKLLDSLFKVTLVNFENLSHVVGFEVKSHGVRPLECSSALSEDIDGFLEELNFDPRQG